MSNLFICVVIPCLNEEKTLADTCRSLGFGASCEATTDAVLILVDNGSVDQTKIVAEQVQSGAQAGSVILIIEPEQGYVPARRRGINLAAEMMKTRGIAKEATLIVQADADTIYAVGYLEALRQAAVVHGTGVMLDARMEWPSEFIKQHESYISLCDEVDKEYDSLLSDNPYDVVVDDKACAFRLADYEGWGGHQREFSMRGDEIFSETTRLYLRAKAHGARRALCDEALAWHSARRIVSEPALSFATAGFPRDLTFRSAWEHAYGGPVTLTDFADPAFRPLIKLAIEVRQAHLKGIFGTLPFHVARALGENNMSFSSFSNDALLLPKRNVEIVRTHPATLLEDIFQQVDQALIQTKRGG